DMQPLPGARGKPQTGLLGSPEISLGALCRIRLACVHVQIAQHCVCEHTIGILPSHCRDEIERIALCPKVCNNSFVEPLDRSLRRGAELQLTRIQEHRMAHERRSIACSWRKLAGDLALLIQELKTRRPVRLHHNKDTIAACDILYLQACRQIP